MEAINYYKLISDTTFIGVATQHNFRTFQRKHQILLACDETKAQYVECENKFYRANWMIPTTTDKIAYETVEVINIDEKEYKILLDAVETGKKVEIEKEPKLQTENTPIIDPLEEVTIEYVRQMKIAEMDMTCNKVITDGFNIVLSDGIQYHFSLQITDQLKISRLNDRAKSGEDFLPYHADNEPCKIYSAEDIAAINATMENLIEYHTTYFNSLKMYINSMESKEIIASVTYGITIPEEYQSEVLKYILNMMNDGERR